MTLVESPRETEAPAADSLEPSPLSRVKEGRDDRRADEACASSERGARHEAPIPAKRRRPNSWRVRVVRIDAQKYLHFQNDREHPFSALAREARVEEIDAFLARVLARSKKLGPPVGGRLNPAPPEPPAASETARLS